MVRVLPYRSVDNFIGGVVITFTDVTSLTEMQQALRESESHAKLLLAELQHRVRNTLSVVRAIARRTAETSETVEEYAMHLDGRLDAFARVQAAVTRNPIGGLDLEALVADTLLAHGAHEGDRVGTIRGPRVRLKAKAAETVALAVHELATNAVKYGALSVHKGRIDVCWSLEKVDGLGHVVFRWLERGMDGAAEPPKRKGFGTELIERSLAYELGGKTSLEFDPDGLHCTIILPLDPEILIVSSDAESSGREL
jgi:two-component system CheB/CheR fusion protein